MILFSTQFEVDPSFGISDFMEVLMETADGQISDVLSEWDGKDLLERKFDDDRQELVAVMFSDKLAIRHQRQDGNMVFQTVYVFLKDEQSRLFVSVSVETLCSMKISDSVFQNCVPNLVRQLFWREEGGIDNGLPTDERVTLIRKDNLDLVSHIFSDQRFLNPIVYVSPVSHTGQYYVNYEQLARDLCGMAHVVVESNPYISRLVSERISGQNPENGSVLVKFGNDTDRLFQQSCGSDVFFDKEIQDYVRTSLANMKVPEGCQFSKLRYEYLLSEIRNASGENEEMVNLCDTLLSEKDKELDELKQKLHRATAKVDGLEAHVQALQSKQSGLVLCTGEKDLYVGEQIDVILKVLEKEYKAIASDKTAGKSRKAMVLKSILDSNCKTGKDAEIKALFRKCFQDGTLDSSRLSDVEALGFTVDMSGKEHYKIVYQGDARLQTSISITPSDYRAGDNLVSNYMNQLFGY